MNMVDVQTSTAKTLGLASSDEITIANVQYGKKDGLGGQKVGYDATTGKGRRFGCTVFMIPPRRSIGRRTTTGNAIRNADGREIDGARRRAPVGRCVDDMPRRPCAGAIWSDNDEPIYPLVSAR